MASACTRYGVHNDSVRQLPPAQITLNASREEIAELLMPFLRKRGYAPKMTRLRIGGSTDFELDWVRDSSLEYFYILSGTRLPHLVHWKAVWRVSELGPQRSTLRVETMELVYMGPREEAGPAPLLDGQWFEAPVSHLRGWIEVRRFFTETFPRLALPRELSLIQTPQLNSPPLSLRDYRPVKLHQSSRSSSF